jgi:hypothetical protein
MSNFPKTLAVSLILAVSTCSTAFAAPTCSNLTDITTNNVIQVTDSNIGILVQANPTVNIVNNIDVKVDTSDLCSTLPSATRVPDISNVREQSKTLRQSLGVW